MIYERGISMYDTAIFYIRETMAFLNQIQGTILALILLVMFIQLGRIRRELASVCKRIRQYFAVITQESPEEKAPKKKEPGRRKGGGISGVPQMNKISQEEAQNFMDVLEDVF